MSAADQGAKTETKKKEQSGLKRRPTIRLHTKAAILGYRRSKVAVYPQWSLLRLEGVRTREDTSFYLGKRVAYIYRATRRDKKGSNIRVIWGRIAKPHGNNGVVRARFRHNLPGQAEGAIARVMLFPSRI
eukprot:TRINITY_DN6547_c0_g1_i2.p1 TRINITY_DN6547_c0_g1~~TRINITY_DN6547_c0_g1_i2.p1  ORF type:complete len:130 (-),score=13.04 TRINITY_DN6547_c0_g1_i2:54-443(-)